jgi:glycosyltransferase involved in cell wall biosynthesis
MKVALLVPTLNEIVGLKVIMPRVKKEWFHEIFFIDGNSTDGTIEFIKENNYNLILEKKPGVRFAQIEAFESMESDIVMTFSPDGNCIPELIPNLIEEMKKGFDMVIASRYKDGAKSDDDTVVTAFGNWLFTKIINILYGGTFTDSLTNFRIYKKCLIKDLDLDKEETYASGEKLFNTPLGIEPILSTRAAKKSLKVGEIAADEPDRIGGVTKLRVWRQGAAYMYQILREKFVWHC